MWLSTGLKFIVLTDPKQLGMDIFLKKIYELYSDFALKNPFYSLDMPIRYLKKVPVQHLFKAHFFLGKRRVTLVPQELNPISGARNN